MQKLLVIYVGWGERWVLGTLAAHQRTMLFEYSPDALRRGLSYRRAISSCVQRLMGIFLRFSTGCPG
ncbi:hypothetical protein [Thauera humireducens]|uniref:hypothetical protein n=1 Tax=Thauera humireducens TaxID=1134435 RepID=UPI00311FF25C